MNDINNNEELVYVLIPVFQPSEILVELVSQLILKGFKKIIVVNDGSTNNCKKIFADLDSKKQVITLNHTVNSGKGAALQTGLNFFLHNRPNNAYGVITVDGDGQHLPEDVYNVLQASKSSPKKLIIGSRSFALNHPVPFRSKIGNIVTRKLFTFITGKKLNDTQSGLRFIPLCFLSEILSVVSNGYEYELEMLMLAIRNKVAIKEVPIKAVYFGNNEHSHFNPFFDSIKIYFVFARFLSTSLLTALIDYAFFALAIFFSNSLLTSLIFGRFVAGSFNFIVSKNWVFLSHRNAFKELLSYILIVIFVTFCFIFSNRFSYFFIWLEYFNLKNSHRVFNVPY